MPSQHDGLKVRLHYTIDAELLRHAMELVEIEPAAEPKLFERLALRTYPGWTHHVVLTAVAYAFLQRERMRRGTDPSLTFPGIRAIVQESFTALLFAQQPNYFKRIQELQQINLRI